jgi:hypothetical protein
MKEQTERSRHIEKAMAVLHKAVAAGYRYPAVLKKDRSMDPLRSRADFQKLLAGLEKQAAEERRREMEASPKRQ